MVSRRHPKLAAGSGVENDACSSRLHPEPALSGAHQSFFANASNSSSLSGFTVASRVATGEKPNC